MFLYFLIRNLIDIPCHCVLNLLCFLELRAREKFSSSGQLSISSFNHTRILSPPPNGFLFLVFTAGMCTAKQHGERSKIPSSQASGYIYSLPLLKWFLKNCSIVLCLIIRDNSDLVIRNIYLYIALYIVQYITFYLYYMLHAYDVYIIYITYITKRLYPFF